MTISRFNRMFSRPKQRLFSKRYWFQWSNNKSFLLLHHSEAVAMPVTFCNFFSNTAYCIIMDSWCWWSWEINIVLWPKKNNLSLSGIWRGLWSQQQVWNPSEVKLAQTWQNQRYQWQYMFLSLVTVPRITVWQEYPSFLTKRTMLLQLVFKK